MSIRTLINIAPLEPYTLGNEQGSSFDKALATGKESYIISSNTIPEQTTVFGTLRYCMLLQAGLLKTDFIYTENERKTMAELIGGESFSFEKQNQQFGKIESMSPVFILNSDNEILVPNPFNNTDATSYIPMEMDSKKFITSEGEISLPAKFDAKEGHAYGYICIEGKNAGKVYSNEDIFDIKLQIGNRSSSADKSDGFFKRETVIMKDGFSFAVEVATSDRCMPQKKQVIYMGRKQSAFMYEFNDITDNSASLIEKVSDFFAGCKYPIYYALSDCYCSEQIRFSSFGIVEIKKVRNLETNINADTYVGKRKKCEKQFSMVKAGSVFTEDMTDFFEKENCKAIGYNYLIKMGGR